MKKTLFFLIPLFTTALSFGQTIYSEDFSVDSLPNWTVTNLSPNSTVLWRWNNGTSSGQATGTFDHAGAANGCIIVDSDADGDQNGTTKENTFITSKAIDCSGASTVVLSFYEYFAKYQADTPRVFISNDSINWTAVHNPAAGLGQDQETANPNFVEVNVSGVAANSSTVYIRFSWKGTWDYWWFVDDVRLFIPDAIEAAAVGFDNLLTNGCQLSNAETFKISIKNKGLTPITTFDASYKVNALAAVTESVTLPSPLAFDSTAEYTFTTLADLSAAGTYTIQGWVTLTGDSVPANDSTFSIAISAAPAAIPYTMGFEVPTFGNEIGGFTWLTEDANNDGFTWNLSSSAPNLGSVHYRYLYNFSNTNIGGNDWLFSPCLNFTANTVYKISFFEQVGISQGTVYNEKLELNVGTDNTASAMTTSIKDFGELSNSDYEEQKAAYKPTTSGTKYLGFKCYSDPDAFYLDIDDINISILNPPNAQFSAQMNGTSVNVTDASDELITDWAWSWGDGASSVGVNPGQHTYAAPGSYEICLIVTNLAGADTACQTIVISGIETNNAASQVTLYPNPTNRILNIMWSNAMQGDAKVELSNALGAKVLSYTSAAQGIEKIDMSSYSPGVYFVTVTNGSTTSVSKFVYTK